MLSMFSRNKGIHVGVLSQHASILFSSKVENKLAEGIKVCDLHTGLTLIDGYIGPRVAQVRVVFQIPNAAIPKVFPLPETSVPTHLAYVEWFSAMSTTTDPRHMMQKVSRLTRRGRRCADIIPADLILGSVHLIPRFGRVVPHEWNSFTVLEQCESFYLNPFKDLDTYLKFM
jgi:hypothetical protein